jgi:magnesium chelatase family protein
VPVLATCRSVAFLGAEARLVEVEVHVGTGLPHFAVVGLATRSVSEATHRVRSALESTQPGLWPSRRIIANLAPGALRKEGTHFDLSIALGVNRIVSSHGPGSY